MWARREKRHIGLKRRTVYRALGIKRRRSAAMPVAWNMLNQRWTPDSWRMKPIAQAPVYADRDDLADAARGLAGYQPLFFGGEARELKRGLGKAAGGEAFLLQGCVRAESFG